MVKRGADGRAAAAMKDILAALASYTERHYRRVEELEDESYLVEWVLGEMDGGVGLSALGAPTQQGMNGVVGDEADHEKDVVMLGA
jgi:U3 small nucleolar RNA-associated protein 13